MDWKEVPVVRVKKRGLGGSAVICAVVLSTGIGIGVILQPTLGRLFGPGWERWSPEGVQLRSANVVAVRRDGRHVNAEC